MSAERTPQPQRPYMPGYGLENATTAPGERLPWQRVSEIIAGARTYWVGTVRPDGRPHAAPVWGLWLDGAFYFSTGRRTRKARNLAANPAISVHLEHEGVAVMLEGEVEEVPAEVFVALVAAPYEAKYEWHPEADGTTWEELARGSGLYRVEPRVALSFQETLGETATRWRFGD